MEMTPNNQQPVEENQPSTGLKIGVLIALIVLLIIGILLPIKLVPNAFSSLGDTFSTWFSSKTITLSTNASEIDSGVPFTLSWSGAHQTNGTYVISYPCTNGVHFETSANQPNETIGCDSQYYFSPTSNSIIITPVSTMSQVTDVSLSIGFLTQGATQPKSLGQLLVSIVNSDIASSTSATPVTSPAISSSPSPSVSPAPTNSPTPSPKSIQSPTGQTAIPVVTYKNRVSNPNGTADLAVTINNVGYLDQKTSRFVASKYVYGNQRAAVRFTIRNNGTKNTGTWDFTTMLPSTTNPSYSSGPQQNLGPGDSIQYTLGFDNINPTQNNTISITADPSGLIREASESNNTATANMVNLQGTGFNPTGFNTYQPDLTVTILAIGTLDRNTNTFNPVTANSYFNQNDRIGVQFKVTNIGGGSTGGWQFAANLPSLVQSQQYTSGFETPLGPGQSTIITIGFDSLANSGPNTFTVQVDPTHQINQQSTYNDTASVTLYRY